MGMLFSTGFEAWQQYEAGETAKAAYDAQAAQIRSETAYAQRMAIEEQKDIHAEGRSAASRARAAAGKSGLAVAGSVATLSQAISRKTERRKALVGLQFSETMRRNEFRAEMYRYAGKTAKHAAKIKSMGSLLTGGMGLAKRKEGLGTSWGGLFNKDWREK
jgi:hypothetical protein